MGQFISQREQSLVPSCPFERFDKFCWQYIVKQISLYSLEKLASRVRHPTHFVCRHNNSPRAVNCGIQFCKDILNDSSRLSRIFGWSVSPRLELLAIYLDLRA